LWFSDYISTGTPTIEYDSRFGISTGSGLVTQWRQRFGGTPADYLTPPSSGPPWVGTSSYFGGLPTVGSPSGGGYLQSTTPASAFSQSQPHDVVCILKFGPGTGSSIERIFTGAAFGSENALWADYSGNGYLYYGGFWDSGHNPSNSQGVMVIVHFSGTSTTARFRYADGTVNSYGPSGTSGSETLKGFTLLALPNGNEIGASSIVNIMDVTGLDSSDTSALDQACRDIMGWT
jgi:hypothetical protein